MFILLNLIFKSWAIEMTLIPEFGTIPQIRQFCTMKYHNNSNSMIMFGGNNGQGDNFGDLWKFNLEKMQWQELKSSSFEAIPDRFSVSSYMDQANNEFYIFGGNSKNGIQNDLWKFSLDSFRWKSLITQGDVPPPRYRHAYNEFLDSEGKLFFVVFGGYTSLSYDNELFL